ncbi:YfgM family protein [Hydrogenophaga pseudoflava]|uniref:YfgM family protein n=1 Tax=Hydrogenophaga pseudoflava TaxID=47421 RepID=UPI0027E3D2FD|nr:tetratricopeptide repeat protein [Hydrogenophaga pseudoflava]MDQ7746493.1 tetratricopeptide repeat protein [Hydrogenophaga pseudoflava]
MATHLDLEEQEQIDQLKHFWAQYGNLITWVLIVVLGGFAAWNGWNWWQRSQSIKAAALYDEIERAADARDPEKVERALADMKDKFGGTSFAAQGAMLAAQSLFEAGKSDGAKAALSWVANSGSDDSYKAVARLRLAGVHLQAQAYEEALKALEAPMPEAYAALVADRRGDVLMAQGKADEAKAQYQKAWDAMSERTEYRQLVQVKLAALGVNVAPSTTSGVSQ